MEQNRAFQEMLAPAKEWLSNHTQEELSQNAAVSFDETQSVFVMKSLGKKLTISFPEFEITPTLDGWQHLILLHYLAKADGAPLSTEYITFGNLKDGLIRGTKFDHTMDGELARFLAGKTPEQVRNIFEELGGEFVDTKADLSVVLPVFPRYPVRLNIYFEDEEFPASGKMLVNKSADHYLTVEDAVTVGELVMRELNEIHS